MLNRFEPRQEPVEQIGSGEPPHAIGLGINAQCCESRDGIAAEILQFLP